MKFCLAVGSTHKLRVLPQINVIHAFERPVSYKVDKKISTTEEEASLLFFPYDSSCIFLGLF